METSWIWVWCTIALFGGILVMLEVGWRIGCRQGEGDPTKARAGLSIIDGSIYGLLGLMIAFTFSGAASRFDDRRQQIIEEVNAVGTAWGRIDLLPAERQVALRQHYRDYLDERLCFYAPGLDEAVRQGHLAAASQQQAALWVEAVSASKTASDARVAMLLLPAINAMFDIATMRLSAVNRHPPALIFVTLVALVLSCAFLVGHGMSESRRRNWLHALCYAGLMSFTFYVILDFEHPRIGLIRIDAADKPLHELRDSMK